MRTIDFKNFKLYKSIDRNETVIVDARRDFADLLYQNSNGIVAHDLALRIYKDENPIELTEEEYGLCESIAKAARPIFFDSFLDNIKTNEQNV